MLRFEGFVYILIQFLVGPGGFGSVDVAATCDMAVRRVEVERAGNDLDIGQLEKLSSLVEYQVKHAI
jgi:hypothetical protein